MTRTFQSIAVLVCSLALPNAAFAEPGVQTDSDKAATHKVRERPVPTKRPTTPPVHPMAKKLQAQVDRSLKQSGMISVHAKRMEQTIRRSAATRLWADSLRRKLSQNATLGKDTRQKIERAMARADEESRPVQERRKSHKAEQSKLLLATGFSTDRQLSAKLVGQIKEHNRQVAMLHRILFIAAQENDYATATRAETILERTNAQFTTFLTDAAKTDAPIVSANAPD